MRILKWAFVCWSSCATLIIILGIAHSKSVPVTETRVFCAYNRIFVEFDENGKRWGTIMIDYNGRAIPCVDDNDVKIENTI